MVERDKDVIANEY
jgi:hypothetical protein